MRRYEREVKDPVLIKAMLEQFDHVNIGFNDEDGIPYVLPLNFGFEMTEDKLYVYVHMAKQGKKINLIQKDARVGLSWSLFNDFPDHPYKKHRHDYRSVMAKGTIKLVDAKEDYETFKHAYDMTYVCNHREIVPLESRKVIPPIYFGIIECDMKDVTAKSEFPIRNVEDVPFINVYEVPEDDTPFDISDLLSKKNEK